jgi:hypothetical protein
MIEVLSINFVAGPTECEDITVTDDGEYTIYPNSCDILAVACLMEIITETCCVR